jgi:hypothetical protein
MTMGNEEERFEADLRAARRPSRPASPCASAFWRRRCRRIARRRARCRAGSRRWTRAGWRLLELGSLAAAASLAIGIFAGASGLVPDSSGTAATVASNDSSTVDLVALAYDDSGISGDLQ